MTAARRDLPLLSIDPVLFEQIDQPGRERGKVHARRTTHRHLKRRASDGALVIDVTTTAPGSRDAQRRKS